MKNIRKRIISLVVLIILLIIVVITVSVVIMKESQVNIELPAVEEKAMAVVGEHRDFGYTGEIQEYIVPVTGVYQLEVWGATGGYDRESTGKDEDSNIRYGSKGGYSYGSIRLEKGDSLYICVGGKGVDCEYTTKDPNTGGYNGGGGSVLVKEGLAVLEYEGGGGGGATHIALNSNLGVLSNYINDKERVLIVAGGGAGAITIHYGYSEGCLLTVENRKIAPGGGSECSQTTYDIFCSKDSSTHNCNVFKDEDYEYKNGKRGLYGVSINVTPAGQKSVLTGEDIDKDFGKATATNSGGGWYGGTGSFYKVGGTPGSGHIGQGVEGETTEGQVTEDGNGKAKITLLKIDDETSPTITVNPASGEEYVRERDITITVADNEGGTGLNDSINSYQYFLSSSSTSLVDGAWTNYINGGTYTIGAGKSGTYYLFVRRIMDNVGNVSTTGGDVVAIGEETFQRFGPYNFDNIPPTITVNPTSGGYVKTRNVTITVGETGGSNLSSSNSYQYYLSKSNTALEDGAWTNYTSGRTFTIGTGKTGRYYLIVKKITDNAGNANTTVGIAERTIEGIPCQIYGEYYFDNTPPVIEAELVNNIVKITASDVGSGLNKYRYITSQTKLTNPSITAQNSTELPAIGQITIPNINEVRYIYMLVDDIVGNISRIVEVPVPQITLEGEVNLEAEERKGGVDLNWQIGGKGDKAYKIYQQGGTENQWREINTTNELNMTTSTSKDITAPNAPTITVKDIDENDKINISQTTTDNGTAYKFYATACDRENNNIVLSTSGEVTKEVKTGVKGYYYILTDTLDSEFDIQKATYTEEENIKIDLEHNGQYIRMKAVDVAGNISEENNALIYITTDLTLNLEGGELKGETGTVIIPGLAGKRVEVGSAEKEGHTFVGWEVKKLSVVGSQGSMVGTRYTYGRISGEATAVYDINNYGYKIEYYYAGVKDESKTKTGVAEYSSIIDKYTEEPREGYVLGTTENYPLTIKAEENKVEGNTLTEEEASNIKKNIMKIYYVKRTDLEYTINYLEEGTNKVIHEPKEAKGQTFEDIITAEEEIIEIPGYYYARSDKENITIAVDKSQNVINLYYTKRNDLTYTIKYLEKGTEKEIYTPKVITDQLFESTVEIAEEEKINIDGYNYDSIENAPITITAYDEENIVKIYYTKRNDLSYTVKHIEKDTNKELHEPSIVENQTFEDIIVAKNQAIEIPGYNYNSSNKETLIIGTNEEENVIELYYTKRNDLSYTVNYLEEETHEELHEPKVIENQTFEDVIIAKDVAIEIDGYEYSSCDKESITIGINEEENIITIYYIKRSDLKYTINYLDKETLEEIHEPKKAINQVYGGIITADKEIIEIDGYNYSNYDKESITIGTDETKNVINMYYTIRTDIKYTVEYYYDGEKDLEATEEKEATYKEEITSYTEKMPEKYVLVKVEGMPLTIGVNEEFNIIKVYYATKAQVKIQYIDKNTGEVIEEVIEEGYIGKEIETGAKDIEDYILVEEPKEKIMTEEEQVIKYYYVHVSKGVIEKHIDIDTGEILYNEVYEGNEGDEYKIEPKEFERYNLVEDKKPENSEGIMTIDVITVTYYYKKEEKVIITVKYLDKETKDKIGEEIAIIDYKGETYKTDKKDIEGYELVGIVGQQEGTITENMEIIYYYQKVKVPDNEGNNSNGNNGEITDSTITNGRIPNAGIAKQIITGTAFIVIIVTMATLIVFAIKGTIIYNKYKNK